MQSPPRSLPPARGSSVPPPARAAPPDSWDWRDMGVVPGVMEYPSTECAAPWAFSAARSQETQWAIVYGTLMSLSAQELLDCADTCYGCDGGWVSAAFDYVIAKQAGQFMLDADYPYSPTAGPCQYDPSRGVTKLTGYQTVTGGDEAALQSGLYMYGVPAAMVDASSPQFQLYAGGIFRGDGCSSTAVNENILIVGFGVVDATPYWILQLNWGTAWGERGYMRLIRNAGNACGIASDAIFPTN